MKTLIYCITLITCICLFKQSKAQCTVTLSGDTCINQIISADISPLEKIKKLEWSYNGSVVFSQPHIYSQDGLKIVGADSIGSITDIAVDDAGNTYINDWNNKRILKFLPGSSAGIQVATTLVIDIAGPRKLWINDFCVYKDTVYLAEWSDTYDNKDHKNPYYVTKWTPGATSGQIIMGPGSVNTSYKDITAITVDKNGVLYIADKVPGFSRVSKLNPGATIIDTVMGSMQSLKRTIDDLQVDNVGNVYTLFRDSAEVRKWVPGASTGTVVAMGTPTPSGESTSYNRKNFVLDSANNIYLTTGLQNVYFPQVFGTQKVLGFKSGSSAPVTLLGEDKIHTVNVSGIALDKQNNLYVADFALNTVHKFSIAKKSNKIYTSYKPVQSGNYTITIKGQNGCIAARTFREDAPVQFANFYGPEFFCPGQPSTFYIGSPVPGATYTWSTPDGTILSGQGSDSVTVMFNNILTAKISVSATNHCTATPVKVTVKCKQKCVSLIASSAVTEESLKTPENKFNINPNPSNSFATLRWRAESAGIFLITVTDLQGKTIITKAGKNIAGVNSIKLDVSSLLKGLYIVSLRFDKTSLFQKMIKS